MTPSAEGQEAPGALLDKMLADFAARHRQHPRNPRGGRTFACRRLIAIERLIWGRHGGWCNTDEGEIYFEAALPYLAANAARHRSPILPGAWARRVLPWLYEQKGPAWFSGKEKRVAHIAFVTADQLARQLAVTYAEVRAFGLSTIGAVDRSKAQRLVERREKDRERKRLARLAAGMTPRADALATAKPWAAAGMSRSAWYAAGKPVALVRQVPWTNLSAPFIADGVRTKSSRGSLTTETTMSKPWVVEGISRATWFRRRSAATVPVVMPDPTPVVDGNKATVPQAPTVVLEVGRVRFEVEQLAAWQECFPGVDVVEVVTATANSLNEGTEYGTSWQEMAEAYLSLAHFEMVVATTPANENDQIIAEAV